MRFFFKKIQLLFSFISNYVFFEYFSKPGQILGPVSSKGFRPNSGLVLISDYHYTIHMLTNHIVAVLVYGNCSISGLESGKQITIKDDDANIMIKKLSPSSYTQGTGKYPSICYRAVYIIGGAFFWVKLSFAKFPLKDQVT